MIQEKILELTEYGLVTGLVKPEDKRYTINRLLELFALDELEDEVVAAYEKRTPMTQESAEAALEDILTEMLDYAAEQGLMAEDTVTYRDLFDTKIMSMLMPRPSEVVTTFKGLYNHQSAQAATDYFYKLSCDSNYVCYAKKMRDMQGASIIRQDRTTGSFRLKSTTVTGSSSIHHMYIIMNTASYSTQSIHQ